MPPDDGLICPLAISDACDIPCPHAFYHERMKGCEESFCKIYFKDVQCVCILLESPLRERFLKRRPPSEPTTTAAQLNLLREMDPFLFQHWAILKLGGQMSPTLRKDSGIDGYTELGTPVQVKRQDKVTPDVVVLYETALRRMSFTEGIIIAFSFTKSAEAEAQRALKELGQKITLLTTKEVLLYRPDDKVQNSLSRDAEADGRGGPSVSVTSESP